MCVGVGGVDVANTTGEMLLVVATRVSILCGSFVNSFDWRRAEGRYISCDVVDVVVSIGGLFINNNDGNRFFRLYLIHE